MARNGFRGTGWSVDPYAARAYAWPIPVRAVSGYELPSIAPKRIGTRHCDGPGVAHAPNVEAAARELAGAHSALWGRLDPRAQVALSTAHLLHNNPRLGAIDEATAAIAIARALELELCEGFCRAAKDTLVRRGLEAKVTKSLHSHDKGWKDGDKAPSLGQASYAVAPLCDLLRTSGGPPLSVDFSLRKSITSIATIRNRAAHPDGVGKDDVANMWSMVVPDLIGWAVKARRMLESPMAGGA
jgi:hypothetical protein